jgi:hypothetical protein
MKILIISFAIICALQALVNFIVGSYVVASIHLLCTLVNVWSYANLRKVK